MIAWSDLEKRFYKEIKYEKVYPDEFMRWMKKILIPSNRSSKQNRALHLYFNLISEQLTNLGFQYNYVCPFTGEILEIKWSMELVKNYIWRPIQLELFNKKSTRGLTTLDINEIIEILDQNFSMKGFEIEFPNWHSFVNKLEKNGKLDVIL